VAAAFYTPGQDTIVVVNPTPTTFTVPVTFQNPGLTPTQAVLYQIVNGAAIDSSPVAWAPQGTGYTTSLSVGAYSVQAISLIGR